MRDAQFVTLIVEKTKTMFSQKTEIGDKARTVMQK